MASLIGGLWVMSGSAPLAAQTTPSATRSFSSATVQPGASLTVTINVADYGGIGAVTEMLPDGFTYVSSDGVTGNDQGADGVRFTLLGETSFTYMVTASSTAGEHTFTGTLRASDQQDHTVGGDNMVTVAGDTGMTTPTPTPTPAPQTGPEVTKNNLEFDVVPAQAVKGATVSGVGYPISTNPLKWVVDNSDNLTLGEFDGEVGNFKVVQTADGSDEFMLMVADNGAPDLRGSQSINVVLTYTNDDEDEFTSTLMGTITERDALEVAGPVEFTIPQNVGPSTPIYYFDVSGNIDEEGKDESLDGIISGADAAPFGVNDADMTIYRKNGVELEVRDYEFLLTVNGDAGLAARADRANVKVTVTASNDKHSHEPGTFAATIYENMKGAGLVEAGTVVGNPSEGITNPDGDKLTYSENSPLFEIDSETGQITVGPDDIADGMAGAQSFEITVSDGVTANNEVIMATVMVDANDPVTPKTENLPATEQHDGVTFMAPATYTLTTAEVAGTVNGYEILHVSELVELDLDENGETETPTYTPSVRTTPLSVTDGGQLLLTHVPRGIQDGGSDTYTIMVGINDRYNTPDTTDLTITLVVTVEVKEKPDQITPSLMASIDENETGKVQDALSDLDATNNATLGRLIGLLSEVEDAGDSVEYKHTGGTNGGEPGDNAIFEVDDETGMISLNTEQDADSLDAMPSVVLQVERDADGAVLGVVFVAITINDVNEAPEFMAGAPSSLNVEENAQPGTMVGDPITATDQDEGDSIAYSIMESGTPFSVNSASGQISVSSALDLDASPYSVTLVATDNGYPMMTAEHALRITVGDVNDPPRFDQPAQTTASIPENTAAGTVVATYNATDADGSDMLEGIHYELRDADDLKNFDIMTETSGGQIMGKLVVKEGANLDVDADGAATSYTVEVNVKDADDADSELVIVITVTDVNDNKPLFTTDKSPTESVPENSARGTVIGTYVAEDADRTSPNNTITYSLKGDDADSFELDSTTGVLMTLASLDFDSESGQNTPCNGNACEVTIVATDGGTPAMSSNLDSNVTGSGHIDLTINLVDANDSVSGFTISKANPIANISSDGDDAMTALADAKTTASAKVPESPADLPATMGSAPRNFVSADWGNWGTVLRIEVTSPSPDPDCGNGNQCVFVSLDADSSGESIRLEAYRSSTQENLFIAAVKLVKREYGGTDGAVVPVYKHSDGSVARLIVDEEDDVEIRLIEKDAAGQFVDSKVAPTNVDVENERPEFTNFMPEHEAAFDDGDVEYTFTISDTVSGIPEPEDLPDANGDSDYMPLVALISDDQCQLEAPSEKGYSMFPYAGNSVWCKSEPTIWAVTDDRDFDEVDDGFEVDTKIVLDENEHHYVTFIVCDAAGNCALYTPDNNEIEEAFAKITVDTEDPVLHEARTGIMWDATDEELDKNNSTWIQVIFTDLSVIDEDSVEADDFVVKGHTVKDAKRYGDDADGDAARLDGDGDDPGNQNTWRSIFLELEDELAPDEEPNVSVVPNGIMDKAGNEQDDGDEDAKDYIAPSFTVVSIVSPRTPDAGMDDQLAGEDDEVVITLMSDERIQETRPSVTITHVNAPAGSVFTSVKRETCDDKSTDDGYRMRGEIANTDDCQDSDAATGGELGKTIAKVSNTEWTIIVKEPDATGYYSIFIEGTDRSAQKNKGDEGIAPDDLVTDFFERDGDVNTDDAHFFQGDRNLANPAVWVSGTRIEDTEPAVEFKTPLFVELNFTEPYLSDCEGETPGSDDHKAKCFAESDEYAKDSFDSVTVTSFTLNGTDITDSVKTTDDETFLVSIDGIEIGDHEIEIQAMDQAGNDLAKTLSIEFEVEERDDFSQRLNPGWNLVSIPGEPADSDIHTVFGNDMQVRTVYTYNPIIPGGWMVAVRESADSEWQGDLKEITARQGYWVLSDAIQDWDVSIPRLAGGAVGSGTPIQPPVIALYAGWNLVPVIDVTGDFAGDGISATAYLQSLDDGLDLARVLGFDTITNKWSTVMAPEDGEGTQTLEYGSAYWVFVRQAASLVPGN